MSEVPPPSRAPSLAERVLHVFDERGTLARAVDSFEPRPGQREMAAAVSDVLEGGGILLAEAGTGTGKTLAYLVPAILSGQRVLISTGTKNLQEQIYFKDLPALRDALDVSFTATYMKGRGNYLCLHRFEALCQSPTFRSPDERAYLNVLQQWAPQTETGDRAEVEGLPDDLPLWSDIAATNDNCIGTECPQYQECFVTRMRQRAAESDLVIVNHHLLCADAAVRQSVYGEVIPSCSYAVIDEAHQLEDVATQYFGISVSNYRLEELARDGDRLVDGGGIPDEEKAGELRAVLARVREHARHFFAAVLAQRDEARQVSARSAHDRVRLSASTFEPIAEQGQALTGSLTSLEASLALLDDSTEDLDAIARRAREVKDQLRFLFRANDPVYVFYLEVRGRGVFLRAAPIDVSSIVKEFLWGRMQGTVLTSATLAVDGSFDYVRGRLGIEHPLELQLPSEFDFTTQAILYLPKHVPDPRSPAFADAAAQEVIEILRHTAGRAFVLFTSYANLRSVYSIVARAGLGFPLLVQGNAPRSVLLREFRSTPHAVLLATSSFWQGVDVAGDALSCVIIDKLPFASPTEPITAARIEAIAERGEDPFSDYQVPLAILTLQQGLGRLIRQRSDRGVLAILDPRLRTKMYGRRFLASLPPAPVTEDTADLARFFRREP